MVKRIAALFVAGVLTLGFGSACGSQQGTGASQTKDGYSEMAGADLDKIMEDNKAKEDYTVIDVRDKEEYDAGHVKWAMNIKVDELEANLSKIEDLKEKNVVTICNTGKKSAKAAKLLVDKGFKKVSNAAGVKDHKYTTMTKVANLRGPQVQEIAKAGTHTIIDARESKDYEAGHLKGAIHVMVDDVEAKLSEIPKDKPVLVYCYSGNKSMNVAQKLSDAGYADVSNALDGTKEYTSFELEK